VAGGRFDSADGSYCYTYLARSARGAPAEAFARHLDYTKVGPRPLPQARVAGKKISSVVVQRDLHVVVAYGAGAEQLGQDIWLTTCDEGDYPLTREWAAAVRRWEPGADGLIWKSRRDPTEEVFVLWGDPSTAGRGCGLLEVDPATSEPLASGPARVMLELWLVQWRLYLEPQV
jgi:RES domain